MNVTLISGESSRIGRAGSYLLLVIALLLVVVARATNAQQSPNPPQGLSQNSCRQIAVFGEVRTPSRFDAPQRLRLLEVLGRAGGPNEWAGMTVRIVHPCNCSPCDKSESKVSDVNEYNLADVLRGRENANPYVVPGDIVMVRQAEAILVMGNVITQRNIRFSEGMTVTRAIAMTGGVIRSSALVTVRLHRNSSNAPRPNPIMINLRAIKDGRAENLLLQPWDLVEVSDELGHFEPPRLSPPPTWDPPLPKWDPPLRPRKEKSGSTLITGVSRRGSTQSIDPAHLPM